MKILESYRGVVLRVKVMFFTIHGVFVYVNHQFQIFHSDHYEILNPSISNLIISDSNISNSSNSNRVQKFEHSNLTITNPNSSHSKEVSRC